MQRYLKSSRDKEQDGIQFFIDYKMHFILSFVMLYIENIGLQDCVFRVLANRVTYSINTLCAKGLG